MSGCVVTLRRWTFVGSRNQITYFSAPIKIAKKFQRLHLYFLYQSKRLDYCGSVRNRRWRLVTGSRNKTSISQCVYTMATEFHLLYPCYQGRLNCCGDCLTCGIVGNSRWRMVTLGNIRHLEFTTTPQIGQSSLLCC